MNPSVWARLALVVATALVVQVAVLDEVVLLGTHPDVMVLLPVVAGLYAGPGRGAVVGFVAGLAADLVVDLPYGMSALVFVVVGFASGLLGARGSSHDTRGAVVVVSSGLAAAGTALYALLGAFLGQPGMLGVQTARVMLIVFVASLVLSLPVAWSLRWVLGDETRAGPYGVPSGGSALG